MSTSEKIHPRLEMVTECLGEHGHLIADYLSSDGKFDDAKINEDPAEFARKLQIWMQHAVGSTIESLGRDCGIIREQLNRPEIWQGNDLTSRLIGELNALEQDLIPRGESIHRRIRDKSK